MVIQIGLRINRSMNYVISKLKEARVSYYIINRTTGYKEEDKFISEDQEAYKKYLPEAKKYVLIKSKAEAVKLKIDKLLDYPNEAIEKLNKIERILEAFLFYFLLFFSTLPYYIFYFHIKFNSTVFGCIYGRN